MLSIPFAEMKASRGCTKALGQRYWLVWHTLYIPLLLFEAVTGVGVRHSPSLSKCKGSSLCTKKWVVLHEG